jgi:hypothetical protein
MRIAHGMGAAALVLAVDAGARVLAADMTRSAPRYGDQRVTAAFGS